MIYFCSRHTGFGGSTVIISTVVKILNEAGIPALFYGPNSWFTQLSKYNVPGKLPSLSKQDILVAHEYFLPKRPNVFKSIAYTHEERSDFKYYQFFCENCESEFTQTISVTQDFPFTPDVQPQKEQFAKCKCGHIAKFSRLTAYDHVVFSSVNHEKKSRYYQKTWGPSSVIPNPVGVDFKWNPPKERVAGIIGTVFERKNTHVSIQKAKEAGFEKILLYGNKVEPYFERYIRPSLNENIKYMGEARSIEEMYNSVSEVFHYSLREQACMVQGECKKLGIPFHCNEYSPEWDVVSNEEIVEMWKDLFFDRKKQIIHPQIMTRNLLYNVYAVNENKEWLYNIQELNKYSSVFNGKKIVVIKSDKNTVSEKEVMQEFNFDVEFVCVKNDPSIQEGTEFINHLTRFKTNKLNEILFYAHTKGVTYTDNDEDGITYFESTQDKTKKIIKPKSWLPSIRCWRNAMYKECLTSIDEIDNALKSYSTAGCFLRTNPNLEMKTKWYYNGNFWWVNLSKLFKTNWEQFSNDRRSVERYLGDKFSLDSAYCIAYPNEKEILYGSFYDNNTTTFSGPNLSIIILSKGNKSLGMVLQNLKKQLDLDDEIIVVARKPCITSSDMVSILRDNRIKYFEYPLDFSNDSVILNWSSCLATKSHLYFINDCDNIETDAIISIKKAITEDPSKILAFKVKDNSNKIFWSAEMIKNDNIRRQMLVFPNVPQRLGFFSESDDLSLKNAVKLNPRKNPILWIDNIIAFIDDNYRETFVEYSSAKMPPIKTAPRPSKIRQRSALKRALREMNNSVK